MKQIDFSLYFIADSTPSDTFPLIDTVRAALAGGARAVQLREKDLADTEFYDLALKLRTLTAEYGARLFINSRIDIAIAVGADGIHLGKNSIPITAARKRSANLIIGYSSHSLAEASQAVRDGADFLTFGPIFFTLSKSKYGEPLGVVRLAEIIKAVPIPVFALGGIKADNISLLQSAGSDRIALISAISAAQNPTLAASELLGLLNKPQQPAIHHELRINSYGHYLRQRFGLRVSKINVDAGFTCPNRDGSKGSGGCVYCNNVSFSPKETQSIIPLEKQLSDGIAYHKKRFGSKKFIAYFQKYTNTYSSVDKLEELYRRALLNPDVIGLSVGTRPDCLGDDALELLTEIAKTHYVCLELGLQSADDKILEQINRGHKLEDFITAVNRAKGRNFDICAHLIYGFTGESSADFLKSVNLVSSLPINSIKLHQLHVVEGTELAKIYRQGDFRPITLDDYIKTAADFLELLPPDITIQRLYGSAPLDIIVAPNWGLKNNQMWFSIINELQKRGSWQGCKFKNLL